MKIGIIGFGKMGETIALGLQKTSSPDKISGTTRSEPSAQEITKRLAVDCHTDNRRLAEVSDVLILCTKPHQAESVLESMSAQMTEKKLLISICASISTEQLSAWSGGRTAVVRAMPNTPCLIQKGMTVYCGGPRTREHDLKTTEQIFGNLGKTAEIEESLMDAATGLSGCGPAYVYLMIDALSDAGVKVGLSRKLSTLLAAQTLAGAAQMVLERNMHPAALKDEVTTPAGCTIDGLMALEEGGMRVALIKAVIAATRRSEKLRKSS